MAKKSNIVKPTSLKDKFAKPYGIGKKAYSESVDFSDLNRAKTCLETDFPILPINKIASIEGKGSGALKPVYQVMKWWARRRSTVFRSILISAATKAPEEKSDSSHLVWSSYYKNHQDNNKFKNLKVADIFMGGGTTLVEGARLGFKMFGNDLNPVAWLTVKNSTVKADKTEIENTYLKIKNEVNKSLQKHYLCPCPAGHIGKMTNTETEVSLSLEQYEKLNENEKKSYEYKGPQVIYTFWAKHGPCSVSGCGHRTPILTNTIVAAKKVTVSFWNQKCPSCSIEFHVEKDQNRLSPNAQLILGSEEKKYICLKDKTDGHSVANTKCPNCKKDLLLEKLKKPKKKKIELTLLLHPDWIRGESNHESLGGTANSSANDTIEWNNKRAKNCRLIEYRGVLPDEIQISEGVTVKTGSGGGTVPARSKYECGSCGTVNDVLKSIKASGDTGPIAAYAYQGHCPECEELGGSFNGRFFEAFNDATKINEAINEWESRKTKDLEKFWPKSELPFGFMTHKLNGGIPNHGFTHWWKMFNHRQLLVHSQLLKSICEFSKSIEIKLLMLGVFQQYLRNQNLFCFWNIQRALEPMFSNNNFHPKSTMVENSVFSGLGRGDFKSSYSKLIDAFTWMENPWEILTDGDGHSDKVQTCDPLVFENVTVDCHSATELNFPDNSLDLVVTDPPFGDLLHYSELSDFFYVWLRLALSEEFKEYFSNEYTPKTMEVVANRAREPEGADQFYQRLLTESWREAFRVLKPGGMLVFTFHHSEDDPWVDVLESIFNAGFFLTATYPIRSDESKGSGEFGSRKIEFDIIHVCRKRTDDSKPISWAKMRRTVLSEVRQLQELLEHHSEEGLPEADLQVIRRGKALEYYSKHYGKVFKDEDTPMTVQEALVGINQLLEEESNSSAEPPPHNAEPFTRLFLRLFDSKDELPRDQFQKYLRGSGTSSSDFVSRGWCYEKDKFFRLTPPVEIAHSMVGKHKKGIKGDYDQASFLIGACFEGSGVNATETMNNPNFKPHPALPAILTWHRTHGATNEIRNAAAIASNLYRTWESKHQTPQMKQMQFFFNEEGV